LEAREWTHGHLLQASLIAHQHVLAGNISRDRPEDRATLQFTLAPFAVRLENFPRSWVNALPAAMSQHAIPVVLKFIHPCILKFAHACIT
jgi:hypothetical protein